MKSDGLLGRNWLRGSAGDALHTILCGAGHNLRMILAHLRALLLAFFGSLVLVFNISRAPIGWRAGM